MAAKENGATTIMARAAPDLDQLPGPVEQANNSAGHLPQADASADGLAEPVIVAQWWRNRGGEAIRVRLVPYEGHTLIDLRTWYTDRDGKLAPGKGFSASIRHLPRIAAEMAKALAKARELGLVEPEPVP